MMSYPLEKDKGKAFSIFWSVFQFGTFIGSVIALAINIQSGKLTAVSTSTYLVSTILSILELGSAACSRTLIIAHQAFLVIIFIGIASSFLVLGPNRVIRSDGTLVKLQAKASVKDEAFAVLRVFVDWRMLG